MNRRDFIRSALAASAGLSLHAGEEQPDNTVEEVLVMFKCHFDLGFIDTQAGVMRKYLQDYFPQAIRIASSMRHSGEDRYIWTTGSWLLYEYLEQANSESRQQMDRAIANGDIAWHALPFSWQTEMMDASMIAATIGLSKSLDHHFGRTTTGAKMTDVPGHSRGIIAPLVANGITFLDIGVNSASTPPEVPSLFQWNDSDGHSLVMMYHTREYGGVVVVPGAKLAVSVNVRNDNSGPHTIDEIHAIYGSLRQRFPNAKMRAASLTDIANAVVPFRNNFPVVTQEIGDTWIYGAASDPAKVARYREIVRLRREWVRSGAFEVGDATDVALMRRFSLAVEHTWGTDTKTWLDFNHYTPHDLAQMLEEPNYRTVMHSWVEKRDDITEGVAALPAPLRATAVERLSQLKPMPPSVLGLAHHDPAELLETAHFSLALDPRTGAIRKLRSKSSDRDWASEQQPLALFVYQTLSKSDYEQFLAAYVTSKADWAPKDFGKPGIERFGAQSHSWYPKLMNCWSGRDSYGCRVVTQLAIEDARAADSGVIAWPDSIYTELILPDDNPVVHLNLYWFGKKANRLPEALWLTFQPNAPEVNSWVLEKVNRHVNPFDVVRGGNRHMHALSNSLSYTDAHGNFSIETLDAPLIALGERSPIHFSNEQPDIAKGIHVCLFNNGWGTNYIQWFGDDMRYRFILSAA